MGTGRCSRRRCSRGSDVGAPDARLGHQANSLNPGCRVRHPTCRCTCRCRSACSGYTGGPVVRSSGACLSVVAADLSVVSTSGASATVPPLKLSSVMCLSQPVDVNRVRFRCRQWELCYRGQTEDGYRSLKGPHDGARPNEGRKKIDAQCAMGVRR